MNPRRLIAAAAAVSTVLVLQATLVTPLLAPLAISLPAVLVAAVGLEVGPSAGIAIGFSAGLLADLASPHPAGLLALAWLLLGAATGVLADPRRRLRASVLMVGVAAGVSGLLVVVALVVVGSPSSPLGTVLALAVPSAVGDLALAIVVTPVTRSIGRALQIRSMTSQPAVRSRVAVDA